MNHAEKLARVSAITQSVIVPATYNGYKCRPAGRTRFKRHKWDAQLLCERCGAVRNPNARPS
jgi:hypothetical protein